MSSSTLDPSRRKRILRILFISLLLDLISFTFILPLFPSLLTHYRSLDTSPTSTLNTILSYLNSYKQTFSIPPNAQYDIILLGGALGSLFSLLQAFASPIIGHLSDTHGRRRALLASMAGNILSVALWCLAVDFRTFLASRVVGGLSEGNVQLAIAIAADVSSPEQRGATMALVGAAFSVAFTVGPAMGAWLARVRLVKANPFAAAAGVSLALILIETVYVYRYLPETHPRLVAEHEAKSPTQKPHTPPAATKKTKSLSPSPTNPPSLLNAIHFLFLLPFSGLEFSLPFLLTTTLYPSHPSPSLLNGRLLGFIGLLASLLQATLVRRLPPLTLLRFGTLSCAAAFLVLARTTTALGLYAAAALLAVTSASVVTSLNSLASLEAGEEGRGAVLGGLRAWGQLGRGLGPVVFGSGFWWAGREKAYLVGAGVMVGVCGLVWGAVGTPVTLRGKGEKEEEKEKVERKAK